MHTGKKLWQFFLLGGAVLFGTTGCETTKERTYERTVSYRSQPPQLADAYEIENLRMRPRKPAYESLTYENYTVAKGDSYWRIAQSYGIPLKDLLVANGAGREDVLRVGQELQIPIRKAPPNTEFYLVCRGDTLTSIARRSGCSVGEIRQLNSLSGDTLIVGQKILVPRSGMSNHPMRELSIINTDPKDTYVVRRGDTLSSIAIAYGMTLRELMDRNGITQADHIREGQKLAIVTGRPNARGFKTSAREDKNDRKTQPSTSDDDLLGFFDEDDLFDASR
ncbi:MAG: LysM peptidoglycan-binding domain-containing protein [Puniceicoccales bacterium]|jgi:LysM repeat protein|nr:LysM peptidoglycan-binding domain-containing protein [Puniceicoccales bacterium]